MSLLVALGAIWAGGAWYTGKSAEVELRRAVNIANEKLHQQFAGSGLGIQIKNLQIERGWFSSETRYDVVFSSYNRNNNFYLPFEGKVYHGPLPINQLLKGNLKPVILSSEDHILKNDYTAPIFEIANGNKPFTNVMSVDYSQNIESEWIVPYLGLSREVTRDNSEFLVQGVRIKNNISHNKDVQSDWHIDQFSMTTKGPKFDTPYYISFHDINLTGDLKAIPEWDWLQTGTASITVDKMQIQDEYSDLLINGVQLSSNFVRNGHLLDTTIALAMKSAQDKKQSEAIEIPIDYRIEFAFNHADGALLNELIDRIFARYSNREELTQAEWNLAKQIAQKELNIQIKQNLNNPQGNSDSLIDFTFADVDFYQEAEKYNFYELFKDFNIQVNLNKAGLTDIVTAHYQLTGADKTTASALAKIEVEEMLNRAIGEDFLTATEQGGKLNLVLDKQTNRLMLNGNEVPKENVMMALFMLIMSMSGGY